jgi:hypothetical protein
MTDFLPQRLRVIIRSHPTIRRYVAEVVEEATLKSGVTG